METEFAAMMLGGDDIEHDNRREHDYYGSDAAPGRALPIVQGERFGHPRRRRDFGALHLAHETHRDLFAIEVEKGGIAAKKRHQVELV